MSSNVSTLRLFKSTCIDRFMPTEFVNEMNGWAILTKSPYSQSFYNVADKSWDYTPDKSIRISDHLNFESNGTIHCKTNIVVPNNTHYAKGIYNKSKGVYEIVAILPLNEVELAIYAKEANEEEERQRQALEAQQKELEAFKNTYNVRLDSTKEVVKMTTTEINEMISKGAIFIGRLNYKDSVIERVGNGYIWGGTHTNVCKSLLLCDKL